MDFGYCIVCGNKATSLQISAMEEGLPEVNGKGEFFSRWHCQGPSFSFCAEHAKGNKIKRQELPPQVHEFLAFLRNQTRGLAKSAWEELDPEWQEKIKLWHQKEFKKALAL